MGCTTCGGTKYYQIAEDDDFMYYACRDCGNTILLPKGVRIL